LTKTKKKKGQVHGKAETGKNQREAKAIGKRKKENMDWRKEIAVESSATKLERCSWGEKRKRVTGAMSNKSKRPHKKTTAKRHGGRKVKDLWISAVKVVREGRTKKK